MVILEDSKQSTRATYIVIIQVYLAVFCSTRECAQSFDRLINCFLAHRSKILRLWKVVPHSFPVHSFQIVFPSKFGSDLGLFEVIRPILFGAF